MADDIDELLDEVESKFISDGNKLPDDSQTPLQVSVEKCASASEELDAAIHSICSIPGPLEATRVSSSAGSDGKGAKRRCTVVYVGGTSTSSGLSSGVSQRRNTSQRKQKNATNKLLAKRYFVKPVFELAVKDLAAEHARRKQKEIIERLFERKVAMVTDKMILDVRKFKRIKSDVWSNFGDVRLLISENEVKKFGIEYHVIHIGDEEVLLCKSFVACVKCSAVFSYESHSYGTSTLRAHIKSCGRQRHRNSKKNQKHHLRKRKYDSEGELKNSENEASNTLVAKPVFQEQMLKFREHTYKLQEQMLLFFLSKLKSFDTVENGEFQKLLQMCIKIGAACGNTNINALLFTQNDLADPLLNKVYTESITSFDSEMRNQYGLSFAADIWMDIVEKTSYVSLSCYYANDDGVFKSVILHTSEFLYEKKTADDIKKLFFESLSSMNLEHFKRIMVIDYSYNMVTSFEDELFIQCICYSLNSAVQSVINSLSISENEDEPFTLPSFTSLISQCRTLVTHFKQQKIQHNLPEYLKMCSSTCWKSVLQMLESINNQWDHIVDILSEREELHMLSFDQELLSIVVDFLEIFRDGAEELASISNPTLNIVIPWLTKWKNHCFHKVDDSPFLGALKTYMSLSIDDEVAKRITVFHKVATMLDPRFKELTFLSDEDKAEARLKAELMVKECEESLTLNKEVGNSSPTAPDDQFAELYSSVPSESNSSNVPSSCQEVEDYLRDIFVMGTQDLDAQNKFNPLKYWVRTRTRYPYLSKVASWILSCPASCVRNEECLLSSDWMVTIRETELHQKHVNRALFVKSYRSL